MKLLLERILDSYWNKLLCKFCITVHRFHARVQSSVCAAYKKCSYVPADSYSVKQLTVFIAFQTGRKLNSACCNYVHFSHQPLISVAQKRSFPKPTEKKIVTRCTDLWLSCASTKTMITLITNAMWKTCWKRKDW